MSYGKLSIKAVIDNIHARKMYLPALQRRFVWKKPQIQLLFDSLMRNYPIGTFLFWKLKTEKAREYVFYNFLDDFDERNPYNKREPGGFSGESVTGLLDGQQRLSSIFLALMGTYTEKEAGKWASNPEAYQKTKLYINLLSTPYVVKDDGEIDLLENKNFEFKFLSDNQSLQNSRRKLNEDELTGGKNEDESVFWFRVGEALTWKRELDRDAIFVKFLDSTSTSKQKQSIEDNKRVIMYCIDKLNDRLNKDEIINYFEIAKDELEEILQIFVRVNSGGTILTKSDLLFSTLVATWDTGREKIEDLQKKLNSKGDGFNFGIEYLMRCCLFLSDLPVAYRVNSFQSNNVQKIQESWSKISDSIDKTINLLLEFGFNSSLLTSQNSTIIIAYYIYKDGILDDNSKSNIRKYLIHAMLKNIYGSSQEALLSKLREEFREENISEDGQKTYSLKSKNFNFNTLVQLDLPNRRSLSVTNADLDQFLTYKKGYQSFLVLSLLYPNLRYQQVQFHQDHIHPAANFSDKELRSMGIAPSQWQNWVDYRDSVPNLQFLEGRENQSKNATPIKMWLEKMSEIERNAFKQGNYFPESISLEFQSFIEFFEARKTILRTALSKVLTMNENIVAIDSSDLNLDDEIDEANN